MHKTSRTPVLALVLVLAAAPLTLADLDQGMTYYKSGKYMEAAAEFQAIVDTSPSYDFGYYMMGVSFLKMNKAKDAEENFLKAIELNGDKFEYHHSLATAYFKQKQHAKAVASLKTAEPLASDNKKKHALYNLRGLSYASLKKWPDTVEDLEKAKAIQSSSAILSQLGRAYYELGHYDKALPVLRQAAAKDSSAGTQLRLTNTLLNLGAEAKSDSQKSGYYRDALAAAEKFRGSKPNDADANNLAGRAALGAKQYDKAEQAFRKVLAIKSDHCYAMANLGKVYNAQGQWAKAESILKDAASCAPRMAVVYENMGFALQKQKRLNDAIVAYQKAYDIQPKAFIKTAMDTCRKNLDIAAHNQSQDELAKQQDAAEAAEKARIAQEEAKQEAWRKARERDD